MSYIHAEVVSMDRERLRKGRGITSDLFSTAKRLYNKIPIASLVNTAIDALPIELNIPGYQYCGPGTKLAKRLARGDLGINKLDKACKEHDIAYSKFSDSEHRSVADKVLAGKAWERVKSTDASVGERAAALTVAAAMKAKTAVGGGRRRRRRGGRRKVQRGGSLRKHRHQQRTKKKRGKKLSSMARSGKGLYLKPYDRVY